MTNNSAGGMLVLVATPIGNLGDLSQRAKEVLATADILCCEDTRRTRVLLSALGLPAQPRRLVAIHGHNEASRVSDVLGWLEQGRTVAVVSDAGTPAISDPGRRLVAAAAARGFVVTEVPGPSSILMALSLSGLDLDRFCVEGFLPRKGVDRRRRLEALGAEERTTVILEAPGRTKSLLADLLEACGDRPVVVCRELTKVHEEIWRGSLAKAAEHFAHRELRGEVVVVVSGAGQRHLDDEVIEAAVTQRLEAGDSTSRAAQHVAADLGVARRRAYELALARQRDADKV